MPPTDLPDQALLSVKPDPVADADRALHLQRHAAHHVAERVLERKADDGG